ncbi:MAG TPA: hypothetical protein VHN99_08865, partial [Deinococcales bacterium]|nr:hypothetical protein [Deinococcales bacterium]
LAPLGVPSGVSKAVVTVKLQGTSTPVYIDGDGKVTKSSNGGVTLTPASPDATLLLPTGVNYTVCISAQAGSGTEDAWACADTGSVSGDQTVSPPLIPVVDHASLSIGSGPFLANHTYPVALSVFAPDGSLVPSGGFGNVSLSIQNPDTVDASTNTASVRGQLVTLGLVDGTMVGGTLTGMNAGHVLGASFTIPSSAAFNLQTASGTVSEDMTAPDLTGSTVTLSANVITIGAPTAAGQGITEVRAYRNGVDPVASATGLSGDGPWTLVTNDGVTLASGDSVTVYALDAAGNESAALTATLN